MTCTQDDTSHEDGSDTNTLDCGHKEIVPHVYVPGVGTMCRNCYSPISINRWKNTLRTTKTHHQTGETTHYSTWLVGLDEYGRAVYHDEYNGAILKIVPKHHRGFDDDVEDGMAPLRDYPGRMGPGKLINAPTNDVLVAVAEIDTDSRDYSKRDLVQFVTEHAHHQAWDDLSERMCDLIERYNSPRMSIEVEHADDLLEKYRLNE